MDCFETVRSGRKLKRPRREDSSILPSLLPTIKIAKKTMLYSKPRDSGQSEEEPTLFFLDFKVYKLNK